ncbi:hypothetical protein OC845_005860 [Tilletia horrida]|nr:hypothetical protein OC845_005860 [Tilletia horrida]
MAANSASIFARGSPLHTTFDGAQVLWWPALKTSAKPKVVLIFICGNPGLASFYTRFLSDIHRSPALKGRVEIFGVSHRGHAFVPPSSDSDNAEGRAAKEARHGQRVSLYDQVKHKVAVLDAVRRVYPRVHFKADGQNGAARSSKDVKVVLVGHSIGAYIALEVLRARRRDVDGVHLLFPTLSNIAQTPNARSLRHLLHPLTASLLLPLPLLVLSLLPAFFLIPLIRILTAQPQSAAQSTAELLITPGAVINALAMARDEMRIVQGIRPEIKEAVTTFVRRRPEEGGPGHIHAYWAREEQDGWTPTWLREEVEQELKMERVTLPPAERESTMTPLVASPISSPLQSPAASTMLRSQSSAVSIGSPRRKTNSIILHGALSQPFDPTSMSPGQDLGPQSPPASLRVRRLSSAIAKRNFDGSITLERAVLDSDEEDSDQTSTVGGVPTSSVLSSLGVDEQAIVFKEPESTSSSDERTDKPGAGTTRKIRAGRLTSSVCELGMPHAFSLKFSTEMASILVGWISKDYF